jgi:hypothetical protein
MSLRRAEGDEAIISLRGGAAPAATSYTNVRLLRRLMPARNDSKKCHCEERSDAAIMSLRRGRKTSRSNLKNYIKGRLSRFVIT